MFGIYSLRPELLVAKMDVSIRIFSSRYIRFNPFSGHNSGRGNTCMLIKIKERLLVFLSFSVYYASISFLPLYLQTNRPWPVSLPSIWRWTLQVSSRPSTPMYRSSMDGLRLWLSGCTCSICLVEH